MKKQDTALNLFIIHARNFAAGMIVIIPVLAKDSQTGKTISDTAVQGNSGNNVQKADLASAGKVSGQSLSEEEFNTRITNFLLKNPKVVVDALQKFGEQQQADQQQKMQASLMTHRKEIASDSQAAVLGNADAPIKLVVFLDPNCPHCRHFEQAINKVRGNFPDVAILLRHWAILGKDSEDLARGLWAVKLQGVDKYHDIARTIADSDAPYTYAKLLDWATTRKLDIARLEKDAQSEATRNIVAKTNALAQQLGLQGTPTSMLVDKDTVRLVMPTDEKTLEAILKESSKA